MRVQAPKSAQVVPDRGRENHGQRVFSAPAPVAAAVTPEQLRDASLMLANKKGDAAYRTIYAQMGSKPLAAMTDAERATMYQLVVTATNQP